MTRFADTGRPRRKPGLTPMIDVVFLLLVFFMLASRFGLDAVLPLPLSGGGAAYDGPPRLVEIGPETIRLNGIATDEAGLAAGLAGLTAGRADPVVLRGGDGARLQRMVDVAARLRDAGFTRLVLVE